MCNDLTMQFRRRRCRPRTASNRSKQSLFFLSSATSILCSVFFFLFQLRLGVCICVCVYFWWLSPLLFCAAHRLSNIVSTVRLSLLFFFLLATVDTLSWHQYNHWDSLDFGRQSHRLSLSLFEEKIKQHNQHNQGERIRHACSVRLYTGCAKANATGRFPSFDTRRVPMLNTRLTKLGVFYMRFSRRQAPSRPNLQLSFSYSLCLCLAIATRELI